MDLLVKIADALRSLGLLHSDIEKISGQIESAAAEYKTEHNKEASPPTVNAVLHRPQSEIDHEEARAARHEAHEDRHAGRDSTRLLVEAIGLGIAFILAIATIELWLVTKEATRIAAISATASEKSAEASQQGVEINKRVMESNIQSFHTEQRAWLDILPAGTVFDANQPFKTQVVIKNAGKTPAKNVSYGWRLDGATKEDISKLNFDQPIADIKTGILPPEGQMIQAMDPFKGQVLGQQRYDAIGDRSLTAFFYGRVRYDDVFGCHHWIKFCYVFNPDRKIFDLCSVHNSMDEEVQEPCHGDQD